MKTRKHIPLNLNPKTRDYLMLKVIQGVTKSGTHTDQRKEASRKACRGFRGEE
jgi:hypothetical protein